MRVSTMKGMAAGSLIGLTVGAGLMMMPQGKRMKRVLAKNGPQLVKQVAECWIREGEKRRESSMGFPSLFVRRFRATEALG